MRSPTRKSFLWTVICFTVEMIIIYLAALLREHRFLYGGAAIGIVYLLVSLLSLKQKRKRMEHPGGDGNGNKRNRRKSRKRTLRGFTRIVLCLLPVLGTVKLCGLVGAAFLIPGRGDSVDSISVEVTAKNAAVMSADTGALLYQKNGTDRIAPASTAKMITALTVLDVCSPDDGMTVGEEIRLMREDSSRAWLNRGDMLTVRQLLIALLLPSGNDAAYTLAANAGREIAGDRHLTNEQSIDVFMDKVNETVLPSTTKLKRDKRIFCGKVIIWIVIFWWRMMKKSWQMCSRFTLRMTAIPSTNAIPARRLWTALRIQSWI